jgi:Dolichyl-phosphate-mannose-protein mannosyltransferase
LTSSPTASVSFPERLTALALCGVALLLRVPYAFTYRFNSDEPQHLHVVWGWTRGLLQYRDVFDNHPPLFHLAMAPVLALVGERAAALPLMRLALLPFWVAALALTFSIAHRLYSHRVALWATTLVALFPGFFFTSLEFRSDVAWTVSWLAALAVLAAGALTRPRAFAAGLLLGVALGISQKTVLLLFALGGAALLALVLVPDLRVRVPLRRAAALGASCSAGIVVVPALLAAGFAAAGAFGPMVYCTVTHNIVPGLGAWAHPWRAALFPVGVAGTLWLATPMVRAARGGRVAALRLVLLLATVTYVLGVHCLWPLVTGQDWLPIDPLAATLLVGAAAGWAAGRAEARPVAGRARRLAAAGAAAVLAAALASLVLMGPVWRDSGEPAVALVGDVLRLTDPGDVVIDAKGETVFRRRAWYWVLESVTRARLRRGMIPDSLPEELVARGCCVATLDDPRFPPHARSFLAANYLPVGRLRVAGTLLPAHAGSAAPVGFRIAIPAEYTVLTDAGPAAGVLDGTPFTGPRMLGGGRHDFVAAPASGRVAVVWAKAAERGFSPFKTGGGAP